MVGTRWVGFPAIATGAVAQSVNGGLTFRTSTAAYVPITLTALSCPTTSGCVAVGGDTVARITLLAPKPASVPLARMTTAGSRPPALKGSLDLRRLAYRPATEDP